VGEIELCETVEDVITTGVDRNTVSKRPPSHVAPASYPGRKKIRPLTCQGKNRKRRRTARPKGLAKIIPPVWLHLKKGDIMFGVFSRPRITQEMLDKGNYLLSKVFGEPIPPYPRSDCFFIETPLSKIPWKDISKRFKNRGFISIRINTTRSEIQKSRIPFNKEEKAATTWSSECGAVVFRAFGGQANYLRRLFYFTSEWKELLILYRDGQTAIYTRYEAMGKDLHDDTNMVLSTLYHTKTGNGVGLKGRREVRQPPMAHLGVHAYRQIGNPNQYGGHSNYVRFYREVPNPLLILRLTALYRWVNHFFQMLEPTEFNQCLGKQREDLRGYGPLNVHAVSFDSTDVHADPEKWLTLLTYYLGPPEAEWTGGGELVIPELALGIQTAPRMAAIMDGRLYHYGGRVFGSRFCVASYCTHIELSSYLHPDFSWVGIPGFGVFSNK